MLRVVMLNVVLMSVVIINVVMMSVVAVFILPEISKFALELFSTTKYTVFCLYPTKHSSEPIVNYKT
jgi:hypothetical protein